GPLTNIDRCPNGAQILRPRPDRDDRQIGILKRGLQHNRVGWRRINHRQTIALPPKRIDKEMFT
ncbi:MAG: hypothetical protein RJB22_879, partial [Pseudomonadota bacterium]